jgi:hypothetical protein
MAGNDVSYEAFNQLKGGIWLESARMARKAGALQTAYRDILQADKCRPAMLQRERAKLRMELIGLVLCAGLGHGMCLWHGRLRTGAQPHARSIQFNPSQPAPQF